MFGRILQLQYNAYGPHDQRCFVTIEKINMVKSQGNNFEDAMEELRKIFSVPVPGQTPMQERQIEHDIYNNDSKRGLSKSQSSMSSKSVKTNKVLKVWNSMRKKPTAQR